MTRVSAFASVVGRNLGQSAALALTGLAGGSAQIELAVAVQKLEHVGRCVGLTPDETTEVIHHWTRTASTRSLRDPEIQDWIRDRIIARALGKEWWRPGA